MAKSWGFIGGGRVTRIFLEGLDRAGKLPKDVTVSDIDKKALEKLKGLFPSVKTVLANNRLAGTKDIVVLAVHYRVVDQVLEEIRASLKYDTTLVSFAPKFTIDRISQLLGGLERVVRMVPNAPSVINIGYNPITFSPAFNEGEKRELLNTIEVLGKCPQVQEELLEAYVVLTGMGPTYFWFQFAELNEIARDLGLGQKEGEEAVAYMAMGAIKTMYQWGRPPQEVMDLIPAKPLAEAEEPIRKIFREKLTAAFRNLKGDSLGA